MSFKIVKPDEPSIQPAKKMPMMPKEESYRLRRAARASFDQFLPRYVEIVAQMAMSEDPDDLKWAAQQIAKYTLASTPNEVLDPETVTVDSTSKNADDLKALEGLTENGTGLVDGDS